LITGDYSTIHEEKRVRQLLKRRFQLIAVIVVLNACTIAPFSQQAYEQATSLKAEALILMDKATDSFSRHKSEVEAIKLDLNKAYEYAKGRLHNEISTRQWEIIKDPGRDSLGGFLRKCKLISRRFF
jgi:RecB family endonuclease NucS